MTFKNFNIFSNNVSKLFQKYCRNIFQKIVTKAIIKQVGVAHVIPFAPY
jgi:hypothetical protein